MLENIDYLVIGHLTCDLTPEGPKTGGTAAYSSLTALALGAKVGIVTSWDGDANRSPLRQIPIVNYPTEQSTTFENIYTSHGRTQIIHHVASKLDYFLIPEPWRQASIVHLGPVAQEVEPGLVRHFPDALLGLTPQGWLRGWDKAGKVTSTEWPEAAFAMQHASATVISVEDVDNDEERIEEMATNSRILAVTEAHLGSRLYWNGDVRRFRPPVIHEIDATGAGDIYATAFFYRLLATRDPWEAARFATQLAAFSITRRGLESIPTAQEIETCIIEVL